MISRILLLFVWLAGCAARPPSIMHSPPPAAEMHFEDAGLPLDMAAEPAPEARGLDTSLTVGRPQKVEIRPTPEPAVDRKVHYTGWARMRVTKPETSLDEIASIAVDAGGRVDRLSARNVTVRVPVDRFEETWAAILAVGDVMDKSVRADDITEQYMAVDLRVRTLRTMRDRLIRLLGMAKSEEEKLSLLQQITRVTEELDATESRLRTLADLASMSTISIEVVPREAFGGSRGGPDLAGFGWIRSLSPFNTSVVDDSKRIALEPPHEMVSLSRRGPFIAESADGAVLWTLRVPNDPVGDGDFWVAAIQDRIAEEFQGVQPAHVGNWSCLSLQEPGADEPYRWDLCLQPVGKHLHVAQAFYPSPRAVVRYADRVRITLGGDNGGES